MCRLDSGLAENAASVDGAGLVDLSLRSIVKVAPVDRRGARSLLSHQIALLQDAEITSAVTALFAKLRVNDPSTKSDILTAMQLMAVPWSTQNTSADADFIYASYQQETDQSQKTLLDGVLANARGLYRDGISDYNSSSVPVFTKAPDKLKAMAQRYPKSEYAENAAFYLGQYYIKAFFLEVAPAASQITMSNGAFESYISEAEAGHFVTKTFLPAGYFFRALNSWVIGDLTEAKKWLSLGQQKFSDSDFVYVYELFYSTDPASRIDKFLPAKTLFTNTLKFLSSTTSPSYANAGPLIAALRQ